MIANWPPTSLSFYFSLPIPVEENLPKLAAKVLLASDWSGQSHVTSLKSITRDRYYYSHWQELPCPLLFKRVVRGFSKEKSE